MADKKPGVRMDSRDDRIAFRVTTQERRTAEDAALREYGPGGLSRYIRDCFVIGHSVKQAQSHLKATAV